METFRSDIETHKGQVENDMRNTWAPKLLALQNRFNDLVVRRQTADRASALALQDELQKSALALQAFVQERDNLFAYLSTEWAYPDITEHLTYFMALAKMELAIRAEVQVALRGSAIPSAGVLTPAQQWQSAGDWFERYLTMIIGKPRNYWGPSAARHLATCQAAQARLEQKK
jgi:hypothetical protein